MFSPAKLGPLTLRNRIIKAATFEAATPDALVTDDLINYHRLPAAGGVGMTTVAYCAVSPGRPHRGPADLDAPEAVPGLRRLTDAIHAEGAAISAQIGHAGPVANAALQQGHGAGAGPVLQPDCRCGSPRRPPATTSATSSPRTPTPPGWPIDAGFDAVEIHLGHNYFWPARSSAR